MYNIKLNLHLLVSNFHIFNRYKSFAFILSLFITLFSLLSNCALHLPSPTVLLFLAVVVIGSYMPMVVALECVIPVEHPQEGPHFSCRAYTHVYPSFFHSAEPWVLISAHIIIMKNPTHDLKPTKPAMLATNTPLIPGKH